MRTDAEAFTQKAKDQWTDHYKRTEVALREKNDKSSAHVSALQDRTGSARQIIQSSQSATEETIETWRQADEKANRYDFFSVFPVALEILMQQKPQKNLFFLKESLKNLIR